jgi:hypothetical protein
LARISLTGRFRPGRSAKVMAMSERETETADGSASTAEFRAFASQGGADAERPWKMRASGGRVVLLAGSVVVVAIVLAIIGFLVAS